MAIAGQDARQGARSTFAFQGPAPVQSNSAPSGQSRGAEVVGGQSQSGVVVAGPQTNPGSITEGLGQFFGELMRPAVERKQREKFFEGYTAAQSGVALDELTHNGSPLTKIFGPSGFEQGAQFYTAKTKVAEWANNSMADMDRLKRLTPQELATELADTSTRMMTGDPYADDIIQQDLLSASGPMMNTVAKERFAWQQTEAVRTMSEASTASAKLLQTTLVSQAGLGTPTDEQRSATQSALAGFLGGMSQPYGMTDESYRGYLKSFMRGAMQDGNFYAVEAMRRAGVMKVLPEEDQTKLDDAYVTFGNKAMAREAINVTPDLITLDTMIKTERISPLDAAKEISRINGVMRERTGIDLDLFDYKDIRATAGSVVDIVVASHRRLEARQWQIEDRRQDREWKKEDDAADAAEASAQTTMMWGVGQPKAGIAGGMKAGDFDVLANNDYRAGNYTNIARAYSNDGYVSSLASSQMQAAVTSSLGSEYSKDFRRGYDEWSALNKLRPAAAAGYYGKYHVPMQKYDALVRSGTAPQLAYARSFGDPATYAVSEVSPQRRKEVAEAVPDAIDNMDASWFNPFGRTRLNESSKAALVGALTNGVALAAQNTDRPTQSLVDEQAERLFRSGGAERIGAFAWRQKPGTKPFTSFTKLQEKEQDRLFTSLLDRKLKAAGFREGASADNYDILRIVTPNGKQALHIDPEGDSPGVLITADEIVAEKTRELGARPTPPGAWKGPNPYRHIPGETGAARLGRIQQAVLKGAPSTEIEYNRLYGK